MGTSHNYSCKSCKINITVSLDNATGMSSKVMAYKCNSCKYVGDSVIEHYTDWNDETIFLIPSCNECGSEKVVRWDKTCPHCGDRMNDDGVAFLWD